MTQAWRLRFAFDGDTFTLTSKQRLDKRVAPAQVFPAGQAGRFVELRGDDRRVLYRRSITVLTRETVGYPTNDPARPFGRARPRRSEIDVLVPALPGARSVAIVVSGRRAAVGRDVSKPSAAAAPDTGERAVRDLAVVDLGTEGDTP